MKLALVHGRAIGDDELVVHDAVLTISPDGDPAPPDRYQQVHSPESSAWPLEADAPAVGKVAVLVTCALDECEINKSLAEH